MSSAESDAGSIPYVNSVFEQPWWLDAVAPGAWSAVEVRRGDEVVARLPYMRRRPMGVEAIVQPPLTQTLGPWLVHGEGKYPRRLEAEKRLLGSLIEQLPPFDLFRQCFTPALTNWLPFYWAGFEATVRYSYRIEDLTDLDRVRSDFQDHVRRAIRKAQDTVEVRDDVSVEQLIALDESTYARQGRRPPVTAAVARRLDAACAARHARRILAAVDARGRTHAILYVVWDHRTLYALINAREPELQAFGANTLLYWEAIRHAAAVSQAFDFEGSMIEPIEHFVRGFGGRQTPYFCISKAGRKARSALAARSARDAIGRFARRHA